MKTNLFVITLFVLTSACAPSRSGLNKIPTSSDQIDFESLQHVNSRKQAIWNTETTSEYYLKLPAENGLLFEDAILASFKFNGYKNVVFSSQGNFYQATRGMRMNEWGTLTTVYFRSNDDFIELYIRSEIAQDNTGGWRENRAKKVAMKIQEIIGQDSRKENNPGKL